MRNKVMDNFTNMRMEVRDCNQMTALAMLKLQLTKVSKSVQLLQKSGLWLVLIQAAAHPQSASFLCKE